MTNREKIDYLKQYKNLDNYINQLIEDAERLRTRAEKITPSLTGMPCGGDGTEQRFAAVDKLIDLNNEINEKVDQYVDLGREIRAVIDTVPEQELRRLLQHKYIDGKTWEEVAVEMKYCWQHIHKLHVKALNKIVR